MKIGMKPKITILFPGKRLRFATQEFCMSGKWCLVQTNLTWKLFYVFIFSLYFFMYVCIYYKNPEQFLKCSSLQEFRTDVRVLKYKDRPDLHYWVECVRETNSWNNN